MRYIGLALVLVAPSAFSFASTAIPSSGLEPTSVALLLSGVAGIFVLRQREK